MRILRRAYRFDMGTRVGTGKIGNSEYCEDSEGPPVYGALSGLRTRFVGFYVGVFELPDMPQLCTINGLGGKMSVCRIL